MPAELNFARAEFHGICRSTGLDELIIGAGRVNPKRGQP
jgi:hypothetical protein